MEYKYEVVVAGEDTELESFWSFFDNYILTATHLDKLDELVIAWYLAEGSRDKFLESLRNPADPLELILFYRKEGEGNDSDREHYPDFLHGIFHGRCSKRNDFLNDYTVIRTRSDGECMGFCIYEWGGNREDSCRILALSIDPKSRDYDKKKIVWKLLERRLFREGVRCLETSSYQELEFWTKNGFVQEEQIRLIKNYNVI